MDLHEHGIIQTEDFSLSQILTVYVLTQKVEEIG